jgi:murein DD-endopeptidase MepM/ murein hydrolase activator NlpD
VPEAPLSARTWGACRALVAACAVALLASGSLAGPEAARGSDLGDQIADGRSSQAYYQSAMRKQDRVVAHLKHQQHETRHALKQAKRIVAHNKQALRGAITDVQERGARVAELEALYIGLPPEEIPDGYADRLREARQDLARAKNRRANVGQRFRVSVRVRHARQQRLGSLKRSIRVAVSRRESAEDALGAYIVRMTALAAQRAELQSDASLSTVAGFTWPSVGRISQTYGCTGVSIEPRRGSCRHFHDGLDIVSGYGSRVSTAADGVVAFAGWNPWDEQGRAWIMVVSHPDGFVTRYGHLLPGAIARVGRFVRQGEAIGRMGNTGHSTGTHLHLELLRDGVTVNPLSYLPRGMATVKEPRHHRHGDHKGKHPGHRKQAGRHGRRDTKPEVLPLPDDGQAGPAFEPQALGLADGAAVAACQARLDEAMDAEALARNDGEQSATGASGSAGTDCQVADPRRANGPVSASRSLTDASQARSAMSEDSLWSISGPSLGAGVPKLFRGTSPAPV